MQHLFSGYCVSFITDSCSHKNAELLEVDSGRLYSVTGTGQSFPFKLNAFTVIYWSLLLHQMCI